jgi:hypothetical protein
MPSIASGPRYPGPMVRACLAAAGAALLAVTAATAASKPEPNVRGTLSRSPVIPVCIAERPCSAPAPGVVLVFSRAGQEVKRVKTGTAGRFVMRLRPGVYSVRALRKPLVGSGLSPARFRVPVSGVLTLRLELDTGIR